jgi:hypothetical protein
MSGQCFAQETCDKQTGCRNSTAVSLLWRISNEALLDGFPTQLGVCSNKHVLLMAWDCTSEAGLDGDDSFPSTVAKSSGSAWTRKERLRFQMAVIE